MDTISTVVVPTKVMQDLVEVTGNALRQIRLSKVRSLEKAVITCWMLKELVIFFMFLTAILFGKSA